MKNGEFFSGFSQFLAILTLQVAFCLTVAFDVPVARQLLGFFCLNFLPGWILTRLLGLNSLSSIEKGLFSVGLSVAFLMFGGLVLNELGWLLGISHPLSLIPLIVSLTIFIFLSGLLAFKTKAPAFWGTIQIKSFLVIFPLALIPVAGIAGALLVNINGNNLVVMLMILSIIVLFAAALLTSKGYPLAILAIALALLYSPLFVSKYLVPFGSDVGAETFVFRATLSNGFWSSISPTVWSPNYANLNGMLSVTILPTIYATLLELDPTSTFALVFPALFALVPVGLYQISRKYIGDKMGFVSAFLFMAYGVFNSEMLGLNRQMIAELFLVLLLVATLHVKIGRNTKILLFVIFSSALITSHYSLALIVAFLLLIVLVSLTLLKRPMRNFTLAMVVLFIVLMFAWYIYTSNSSVFDSFVSSERNISNQLKDFFNPASRGQTVLAGLGLEQSPTIWNALSRDFAYLTEVFIVIGLSVPLFRTLLGKTENTFSLDYFFFSLACGILLVALVAVPGLANTLNMTRFYQILLIFLAPFFSWGVYTVAKLLPIRKREIGVTILIFLILIPYFLFQTGFVWEVTKTKSYGQSSFLLSKTRMSPSFLYVSVGYMDTYSVYGTMWLLREVGIPKSQIFGDWASLGPLVVYGNIYPGTVTGLSNTTVLPNNSIVYMSTLNVLYNTVVGVVVWNSTDIASLRNLNTVYTNGGSQVCENPP